MILATFPILNMFLAKMLRQGNCQLWETINFNAEYKVVAIFHTWNWSEYPQTMCFLLTITSSFDKIDSMYRNVRINGSNLINENINAKRKSDEKEQVW